jgi:hypothetical protein
MRKLPEDFYLIMDAAGARRICVVEDHAENVGRKAGVLGSVSVELWAGMGKTFVVWRTPESWDVYVPVSPSNKVEVTLDALRAALKA